VSLNTDQQRRESDDDLMHRRLVRMYRRLRERLLAELGYRDLGGEQ
jgi:hypothetical protein